MKFICNNCNTPFDEPRYQTYRDTETGSHVECSCPLCGSDAGKAVGEVGGRFLGVLWVLV